jgi:hypothetical protein
MKSGINVDLSKIAQGAVKEKLNKAVAEVVNNILDLNTDATKSRGINIKLNFKPNDQRNTVGLTVAVKSTLAPDIEAGTTLLIGREASGQVAAGELMSGVPGQEYIDENGELRHDDGEKVEQDTKTNTIQFPAKEG